jgi:iron-sulfur cluster assembly protein
MIQIRPAALRELNRLRAKQQPQALFRLSVQPGGCSDWLYHLSFDDAIHSEDQVWECHGIQVVIAQQALSYVNGLTLDYSEDLMGGGFRFHNPNAVEHCGCGNSFSVDSNVAQQLPLLEE